MRLIHLIASFIFVALLSACGGGGGSPGVSSGPNSSFTVIAPSAVTLQVGSLQAYAIKGGTKPYAVFSSNPAVAMGWVSGDDNVYVGTVVAGTAVVTVTDAKNNKFDIAVTSGSSTPFYMTAATAITITPGVAYAQTYTLGGGTPPYVATSNFPSIATVAINGNQMTITGVQISATTSNITIRDAAGATLTTAVTVGTVPLALNPKDATIMTGSVMRAVITGGTPPYRTIVLDNCLIDVKIVQGNILEAKGNKSCSGSIVTVVDANNQTVSSSVTVNLGTSAIQIAPSTFTIAEDANTPDIPLTIYGVADGAQISVFTTNPKYFAPRTPVKNADGTYSMTLTGGDTCVTFTDNTVPRNGTYTDISGVPNLTKQPKDDVSTNNVITITVLDSAGRQGAVTVTIQDNGLNGIGCN